MTDYKIPERILLVEDDEDDIHMFLDALSLLSVPQMCTIARNGSEGIIQALTPPPFDIIFMDLNMPVLNGYETIRQLKANKQLIHIPIITLSTSDHIYDAERSIHLGASAYFSKPNNFQTLVKILEDILIKGHFIDKRLT